MKQNKKSVAVLKAAVWLVLTAFVGIGCFFVGRKNGVPVDNVQEATETTGVTEAVKPPAVELEDERRLRMDVTVGKEAKFTNIPPEQLGGHFDSQITYLDVTNVSIEVDGKIMHLEEAIRDGVISVEEIAAYARLDARNGFCKELTETEHSLTYFIYRYPKFDLRLVHDIYKSPDGKEHLVDGLAVCDNAFQLTSFYADDEGKALNAEDWGLTIEAAEATSTTLTLNCTQSGGQQIGELIADFYYIDLPGEYTGEETIPRLDGVNRVDQYQPKPVIERNADSQITLDWTDIYGELPSGDYVMVLNVTDQYDPDQVHPLMENFEDRQSYWIDFSIP